MNRHPSPNDKYYAHRELREIDDAYVFDSSSGLYKPKPYPGKTDIKEVTKAVRWKNPLGVKLRTDWLSVSIAVLTLAVVTGYTYYTRLQWQESDLTASIAASQFRIARQAMQLEDKTFRVDQRAWIGNEFANVLQLNSEKQLQAVLQFFNSGKTPATHVQFTKAKIKFSDHAVKGPSPKDISELAFDSGYSAVAPQARFYSWIGDGTPNKLSSLLYESIRHEKEFVYTFGKIKYRDVFGKEHTTTFCFILADLSPSKTGNPDWRFGPCETFNEMD